MLLAVVNGGYRVVAFEIGLKDRSSDSDNRLKTTLTTASCIFVRSSRSVANLPTRDLEGERVIEYHAVADGGFAQTT